VYTTPFDDPEGFYEAWRSEIDTRALALGIRLHKIEYEETPPSTDGRAARAKAERTRKLNKKLVKKARQRVSRTQAERGTTQIDSFGKVWSLGGFAIESPEIQETFIDVEEPEDTSPEPTPPDSPSASAYSSPCSPRTPLQSDSQSARPSLGFR
jgi:hypothetical protein